MDPELQNQGATLSEQDDVAPVNGGPEREDLTSATIEEPSQGSGVAAGAAPTPADPNQAAVATTQASEWRGILDVAREQGFQFDHSVTDDRSALNYLLRQAQVNRQSDIYAQLGRQLAPQATQIQQYLQQKQAPAQPTRQPWEAPEFDERWASLVERDPATGLFVGKPGVPQEIVQKVNTFADWKSKFDRDPGAMIQQAAEAKARDIAAQTVREQFSQYQREQTIQQIVHENSQWLYQVDAGGNRARDFQGNFIPTPVGARYLHHLASVQRMGVADPRQQDTLAKNLVRGEMALAAQQQAQQATQQAANPQTQQAVNQPNRNPLQAQPPAQRRRNPAATEPSDEGLTLAERIRRELAAEGVTDADIFGSAGGD